LPTQRRMGGAKVWKRPRNFHGAGNQKLLACGNLKRGVARLEGEEGSASWRKEFSEGGGKKGRYCKEMRGVTKVVPWVVNRKEKEF